MYNNPIAPHEITKVSQTREKTNVPVHSMKFEERLDAQDAIIEIEHSIQEKYGVETVVVALVERDEGGSSETSSQT